MIEKSSHVTQEAYIAQESLFPIAISIAFTTGNVARKYFDEKRYVASCGTLITGACTLMTLNACDPLSSAAAVTAGLCFGSPKAATLSSSIIVGCITAHTIGGNPAIKFGVGAGSVLAGTAISSLGGFGYEADFELTVQRKIKD